MDIDPSVSFGYKAPAVHRAFQLLTLVANSPNTFNLTGISRQLGVSKSTTHGLVQALLDLGLLEQYPGKRKFILGSAMIDLAMNSLNLIGIHDLAQPYLNGLRNQTGETVFLGVLSRSRGIILATAESPRSINISAKPGAMIPLMAGAVGKIFLAGLPENQAAAVIREQGLPRFTPNSIIDEQDYLAEVAKARLCQYALDNEEYLPGIKAVAAGVGKYQGVFLAVWLVGFSGSMTIDILPGIIEHIRNTVNSLKSVLLTR
ncbi:MAG: IclR family transcriptional regulator [Desulfatirhabdiaceae bacterium]